MTRGPFTGAVNQARPDPPVRGCLVTAFLTARTERADARENPNHFPRAARTYIASADTRARFHTARVDANRSDVRPRVSDA